jgi:hypothetical protein
MYLETILLFEKTPLSELSESKEKTILENFKEKLKPIENEIKAQPSGTIGIKESGNTFVVGFSKDLTKQISELMYS